MSRFRGKDTGSEKTMAAHFSEFGLTRESHAKELPGRPDFVVREAKLVVFVDGDFWHGWRFPQWRNKLTEKWEAKIEETHRRDARNHRKLRRMVGRWSASGNIRSSSLQRSVLHGSFLHWKNDRNQTVKLKEWSTPLATNQ